MNAEFGPETITILRVNEGRYRFRVSEYGGLAENSERLKASAAHVAVYTAGGFTEFVVGRDGIIKVGPGHLSRAKCVFDLSRAKCVFVSTCECVFVSTCESL